MPATLIRNAHVYAPEDLGVNDVLIANGKFLAVGKDLNVVLPKLETIDAKGKILTPGFFDQHIHVTGGGGEGGPVSRTPELVLSELVACGTTSVVGVSGTDFITRSIENLLAKVRALSAEGASTWMYTSCYHYPPVSMSESAAKDMFMVPECLGVKIALGDHRSSFPTIDQLIQLLADIRLAGMISGKIGVLHIHSGNLEGEFEMFREVVRRGFPIRHIRPTHCARKEHVFKGAVEFAKAGGYIDITTGGSCCFKSPAEAIMTALGEGVDPARITISSDGHGSKPRFNEKGEMVGLAVCGIECNLETIQKLFREYGQPLERILPFITKNVADSHGLGCQGRVAEGACANALLFDPDLTLTDVFSKGRQMMREKEIIVKGTFEE
ncbi:MAG: beta-aspartyl-peptidase [Sutterellaceae bacterium]|nr:beta-aspartyl-peptidase [Sutterellaceae bacterium]MDD7442155.1 beta-aspartyl-peptidase [Sutterellaceae bacterium]MDY2868416.1 beta-aspartyl-peptidase [Mesosutterella sp.]